MREYRRFLAWGLHQQGWKQQDIALQAPYPRPALTQAWENVLLSQFQHCLPCPEGIEIGWVIWDLDQIPARGLEQVAEWYAEFPVKASACAECGVCLERCPFDVKIIDKMREAAVVFERLAAQQDTLYSSQRDEQAGFLRGDTEALSTLLLPPTRR